MTDNKNVFCSFCNKSQHQVEKLIQSDNGTAICNECLSICNDVSSAEKNDQVSLEFNNKTPLEIYNYLCEHVVGQEEAKKTLSVAVYNHYKRILNDDSNDEVKLEKSNILMIGPSGTGKTLLAETIANLLNVPFVIADATSLTEAGYVGDDVENILSKLLSKCDYDVSKAEMGIVFIDEIDKIARKTSPSVAGRDVSGEGVQQALLKLIEGSDVSVPPSGGRKHPQQELIKMNTKNILFVCGGAFVGLDDIINKEKTSNQSSIGFESNLIDKNEKCLITEKDLDADVLSKFGLIPELIGRLPVRVSLEHLSVDDMVKILDEPKNSIIKQYQKLFKLDGVDLIFEKDALKEIANFAIKNNTGARGLRSQIEFLLKETMFSVPTNEKVNKVVVTSDNVINHTDPEIHLGERKQYEISEDKDKSFSVLNKNEEEKNDWLSNK